MASVVDVAKYLIAWHDRTYGEPIDEDKLLSLMHLAQLISYAERDRPLFPEIQTAEGVQLQYPEALHKCTNAGK